MRILFLKRNPHLPQEYGGAELSIHDLCGVLARCGHAVAVMSGIAPRGWIGLTNRLRRRFGGEFPADRGLGYPVFRGWDFVSGLPEVIEAFRPTVAVLQGGGMRAIGEACLRLSVPTAMYYRDIYSLQGDDAFADQRAIQLANSQFIASILAARHGLTATVIPPLIEPTRVTVSSTRERVVLVGLDPRKGIDLAFNLAALRPDVPFDFIESWRIPSDQFAALCARAAALDNVRVLHSFSDPRLVYANARIVLMPTQIDEAWGRVATEAHLNGIPVLASRRGGLPEAVGPGGILVDPEAGLDAWAAALSRMWDNAAEYQRLSAAALEYSRRPLIQPDHLTDRLVAALTPAH